MLAVGHVVLAFALTVKEPYPTELKADTRVNFRATSPTALKSGVRVNRPALTAYAAMRSGALAPLVPKRSRSKTWLPWVGAAVGGTLVGVNVADEEDIVPSGKVVWAGIGAAAGAGVGWLIAHIVGR